MLRIYKKHFFLLSAILFLPLAEAKPRATPVLSNPVDPSQWYAQWFAGPILTPQPFTLPLGHPSIEVEQFVLNFHGEYDANWKLRNAPNLYSLQTVLFIEGAVSKRVGLYALPSFSTNFSQGKHSTNINDLILGVGYQILNDTPGKWTPDLRILLQETFPTGKFRNLNPSKEGTDITGQGSFQTALFLAAGKFFKFTPPHNMTMRWSLGYVVPAPTPVKGLNIYGGGRGTNGKVHPGQNFMIYYSLDYSLTRQWGIGFETIYTQSGSGRFSGQKGVDANGRSHEISAPSFSQWTLLPWVGHTFDPQSALLLGGWFTLAGRNAPAFYGAVLSYLYVF